MVIERKIKINDKNYFLGIEIKYNNKGIVEKKDGSYFDFGDLTLMIEYVETNYQKELIYDKTISYMNDIIYLYEYFPFISYIKDISYSKKDNSIYQISCIDKQEIIDYIKLMKIEINRWDKNKCICPLLYK